MDHFYYSKNCPRKQKKNHIIDLINIFIAIYTQNLKNIGFFYAVCDLVVSSTSHGISFKRGKIIFWWLTLKCYNMSTYMNGFWNLIYSICWRHFIVLYYYFLFNLKEYKSIAMNCRCINKLHYRAGYICDWTAKHKFHAIFILLWSRVPYHSGRNICFYSLDRLNWIKYRYIGNSNRIVLPLQVTSFDDKQQYATEEKSQQTRTSLKRLHKYTRLWYKNVLIVKL